MKLRSLLALMVMFLPSPVKILIFRKLFGFEIGRRCYIGFSYILVRKLTLGDNVYIGHMNVFKRIPEVIVGQGSRITNRNIFTSQWDSGARFKMGKWSSVALDHYFDITGAIDIGDNCILAGRHSTWFTHSLSPDLPNTKAVIQPISVGPWCYLGSNLKVTPGVSVPDHSFVGMGSVLVPRRYPPYHLLAGNPATPKKELLRDSAFFRGPHHTQPHNPPNE